MGNKSTSKLMFAVALFSILGLLLSMLPLGSLLAESETGEGSPAVAHYSSCAFNTGNNASIAVPNDIAFNGNFVPEVGDEVAIFSHDGSLCVGFQAWTGSNIAIAAWGDDTQTETVDGLQDHEIMQFRIWDQSAAVEHVVNKATYAIGDKFYAPNAFPVIASLNLATDLIYISSNKNGAIGSIFFADEDIIVYNPWTDEWFRYFDGSDVGLTIDVNAFTLLDDGDILLSVQSAVTVPDVGAIDDSDILRFTPSSTGAHTSGTFSMYFDGSDVGLDGNTEDIDAIELLADGRLLLSTTGSAVVPGYIPVMKDEDLTAFTPTQLGETTAGTWDWYYDGSDVELADFFEQTDAVAVDEATDDIFLSTLGAFTVTGASGDGMDILRCVPGTLGRNTTCTYNNYWDGSTFGFEAKIVDGLAVKTAQTPKDVVHMSSNKNGAIGSIYYADEDVIVYDPWVGEWFRYFDGSDVGLTIDVNAFTLLDDGDILLSVQSAVSVQDVGAIDDSDILRFRPSPTSTGASTNGTFSMYFDGSDVGLDAGTEDIDAIELLADGRLLLSTTGGAAVSGYTPVLKGEDLTAFTPTKLGETTEGSWDWYFDGSDVELTDYFERIDAAAVDGVTADIYLSTLGAFTVTGASGDGMDILRCVPGAVGRNTTCTYNHYWDGSTFGFVSQNMDGLALVMAGGGSSMQRVSPADLLAPEDLSANRRPKN